MKSYAFLSVVLLVLINTKSPLLSPPQEWTEAERARVEGEVSDFLSSYMERIGGDEPDAIRELYVADERFAWFSDGEKRYTSADQVLAGLASMEGMRFSTETSEVEILPLSSNLAHARTSFSTQILQDATVVHEFSGVITWLLEMSKNGEWRVLTGHTSTPKPG